MYNIVCDKEDHREKAKVVRGVARGKCMWKQLRVSIWTRSVCDPTLSSWGFGGAVRPPAGPGAEPRKQTHFWQRYIENGLKIRSLTSHVGKHERTYFNS